VRVLAFAGQFTVTCGVAFAAGGAETTVTFDEFLHALSSILPWRPLQAPSTARRRDAGVATGKCLISLSHSVSIGL
jgi:hypothetical protein